MSSKYTLGPWTKSEKLNGPWWHISADYTIGGKKCLSGRQAVACVHGESKKGSKAYAEMFEANARLISAAPELLEALIEVLDKIPLSDSNYSETPTAAKARAAIAKATNAEYGETPAENDPIEAMQKEIADLKESLRYTIDQVIGWQEFATGCEQGETKEMKEAKKLANWEEFLKMREQSSAE